jgi:hypothetical protein
MRQRAPFITIYIFFGPKRRLHVRGKMGGPSCGSSVHLVTLDVHRSVAKSCGLSHPRASRAHSNIVLPNVASVACTVQVDFPIHRRNNNAAMWLSFSRQSWSASCAEGPSLHHGYLGPMNLFVRENVAKGTVSNTPPFW